MRPGGLCIAVVLALALVACETRTSDEAPPPAPSVTAAPSATAPAPESTISPPFAVTAPIPLSPRAAAALAADLAERTSNARFSPERPTRLQPVAGTFLLVAGDAAAPLDDAASLTQRVLDALYVDARPPQTSPLSHRPDKAIEVWLYSSERSYRVGLATHTSASPYEPAGLGLYDSFTRTIVARTDAGGVGAHEIVHPLLQADAPRVPVALGEGVAELFELVDIAPTTHEMRFKGHFRLQTLRDTLASHNEVAKGSIRLDALFSWTSPAAFYDTAGLSVRYGVARESMRWLASTGKLWEFWHACRDGILEDPTCEAAFTKIVGASPAAATAQWLAWIASPEAG